MNSKRAKRLRKIVRGLYPDLPVKSYGVNVGETKFFHTPMGLVEIQPKNVFLNTNCQRYHYQQLKAEV